MIVRALCEHVWIAVLGSVKIFPNLEAALKGVFNRVLKFFPNASVRSGGRREVLANDPIPDMSNHFQAHGEPPRHILSKNGLHALRSSS